MNDSATPASSNCVQCGKTLDHEDGHWGQPARPTCSLGCWRREHGYTTERLAYLNHEVTELLYASDPVGVGFDTQNRSEYQPEAEAIVVRLFAAHDTTGVQAISHTVFTDYFGEEIAGEAARYAGVAESIWALWCNTAPGSDALPVEP